MSTGRIEKALSGFYYVNVGGEVLCCRARGKFRKEGLSPLVGDRVEVRDLGGGEGVVDAVLPRDKAELLREIRLTRERMSAEALASRPRRFGEGAVLL